MLNEGTRDQKIYLKKKEKDEEQVILIPNIVQEFKKEPDINMNMP